MTTNRSLMAAVLGLGLALVALPGAADASTPVPTTAPGAVRAAAAAPATAAPAGKLSPSGCQRAGTEVACDLWAKPGTAQILGQPLPIWGFAAQQADPATAPGPVLVVQQGDHVTVTLHNGLTQPMSLALPGQPASAFDAGLDNTTGVAPGGNSAYTFTATRPGTFVYEAGHTANGARQVAMGLAGALVVLPSDPSGAYGTAATAYDDEAVLVLSDMDPRLNLAPKTFDMRSFKARYRLINGKAFPSTDPIPTDQGHTVLLRYANVGSQPHPMGLLGADQTEVAQDGHPLAYATHQLVADLQPGTTMDTLVPVAPGPESRFTLYETGGHLDNNGQTETDPTRIAFGGMMTFLDTERARGHGRRRRPGAVAGAGDARTPPTGRPTSRSRRTSATSPPAGPPWTPRSSSSTTRPARGRLRLPHDHPGQRHRRQRDGDHARRRVTARPPRPRSAACPRASTASSCVAVTPAGNWGVIGVVVLRLPKTGPLTRDGALDTSPSNGVDGVGITATGDDSVAGGTIDRAEYFIDTLGAPGEGQPLTVNRAASVVSLDGRIPAADLEPLGEGVHHVLVRSHDGLDLWGPELDIPLVVDRTGPTVTAAAVMPNPSNGELDDPGNPGNVVVTAQVQDAPTGGTGQIVEAEGFLDPGANPQTGTGFDMLAVDGAFDTPTEAVYGLIPVSDIHALANGDHVVRVRGRDAAGNWGDLFTTPLTVDKTAPVLRRRHRHAEPDIRGEHRPVDGTRQRGGLRRSRGVPGGERPRSRERDAPSSCRSRVATPP